MRTALYLLGVQGLIVAFDTLFYHEWKARLPARDPQGTPELALHDARHFLYGVLFYPLSGSVSCAPSPASRLNPQIKFVKLTIVF